MKERRLHPLIRLAEERESVVARALAERKRTLDSQKDRLEELQRYAEEYAQPADGPTHPAMLANHIAFRERIKQAVDTQHRTVETIRSHCEVETTRLLIASRETQVLEKLAASYRRQEGLDKARREQREQDEIAARRKPEE